MYRVRPDPGSWIDELDDALSESIRAKMRRFTYADGDSLSSAWQPVKGIFEIYSGAVKLVAASVDGREMILNVIHEGHTMNESLLIAERMLPGVSAICVGPTEVGLLLADDFHRLREEVPEVNSQLLRRLAMRNMASYNQLIDGALHRLELRLAFLIYTYARTDEDGETCLHFTQDDLANMSGVSRQSISRIIRSWEEAGLIELGYGQLRIPDMPKLLSAANAH